MRDPTRPLSASHQTTFVLYPMGVWPITFRRSMYLPRDRVSSVAWGTKKETRWVVGEQGCLSAGRCQC